MGPVSDFTLMLTRREMLLALGALPIAGLVGRNRLYADAARELPRRLLGRTGREVVPLGLGGQGSLQWTRPGLDAPDIIVRAVQLGINYLDTSNIYGPSQEYYGEAFRRLHLKPTDPHYDVGLRESLFLNSKAHRRFAREPVRTGPTAIDELKTALTLMFGDGKGFIPEGAYLDSFQVHNLSLPEQVEEIYEGMAERGSRMPERIGVLPALLDYRDGTNYTGLNPENRRYLRHIGITGHWNSPVLMRALRWDKDNIIDTLLVALNANDRICLPHQNNVLPLAIAKGLGVIAMKIFADGAFYGKPARNTIDYNDVVSSVGKSGAIAYSDLVRYPLSLPGVTCAITGIGQIDRDHPENDQLVANLAAARMDMPSALERRRIEQEAEARHGGTNYFQDKLRGIVQPSDVRARHDGDRIVVEWNTALAGADPIRSYEIRSGEKLLLAVPFRPQLTEAPLSVSVPSAEVGPEGVTVVASEAAPRPS
ncbi:MAG TPA: aldo/keto reductase [Opitutaceae bacterium]|nr:aldo/keto reductase [Opitutaceae bacterium]